MTDRMTIVISIAGAIIFIAGWLTANWMAYSRAKELPSLRTHSAE